MAQVVWHDMFGGPEIRVSRAEAMRVPAVVKGRSLIVGTLSRQPLKAYRHDEPMATQPAWLYRTNTAQSPQARLLWTLDDLIFEGCSLWAVERGEAGQIVDATRVPFEWWEITPDLVILVQGQPVDAAEVIYFEGPQDGLLTIAADDIRASRNMTRAWSARVETPAPLVVLKQTEDIQLNDDEVAELVASYDEARRSGNATAFLPKGIDADVLGQTDSDLFTSGRNMSRLDIANYLGLPAALLEGSTSTASLTYSTKADSRNELVDYSLSYWAAPIEARLSLDDVVPRGQRVAFDLTWLATPTQPTTAPATED
ncbi:phage portal protein [Cellulosimicrobium cellulans]|uniref:phage portal protein n=1 Tax=Cellulosimicrobium cellulans TaxID=1710 RepID=UPI002405430D|nr:phage portal protein [Cellulosimicrobium cellulans]MDF9877469.1 hypothetical protein [Cellulosimicrobium cellulans]